MNTWWVSQDIHLLVDTLLFEVQWGRWMGLNFNQEMNFEDMWHENPSAQGWESKFRTRSQLWAQGRFWLNFPMNSHYCEKCYFLHMMHSNNQLHPQAGALRWSGRLCCQTWSQRNDQKSLRDDYSHYKSGVYGSLLIAFGTKIQYYTSQYHCWFQYR
jgi:hypothetical protein